MRNDEWPYYGITSLKVHNNLKCSNNNWKHCQLCDIMKLNWQNIHVPGQWKQLIYWYIYKYLYHSREISHMLIVYAFPKHRKSCFKKKNNNNIYSGTVVKCQQNDWGKMFYTIDSLGRKKVIVHVKAVTCSACVFTSNVFWSNTPGIYCYGIIQINHIFPWSALQK